MQTLDVSKPRSFDVEDHGFGTIPGYFVAQFVARTGYQDGMKVGAQPIGEALRNSWIAFQNNDTRTINPPNHRPALSDQPRLRGVRHTNSTDVTNQSSRKDAH